MSEFYQTQHTSYEVFILIAYNLESQDHCNKPLSSIGSDPALMSSSNPMCVEISSIALTSGGDKSHKDTDLLMAFISNMYHLKSANILILTWIMVHFSMLMKALKPSIKKTWLTFKILWPSDVICQYKPGSALIQIMPCSRTAPSHYLNQC